MYRLNYEDKNYIIFVLNKIRNDNCLIFKKKQKYQRMFQISVNFFSKSLMNNLKFIIKII